MSIKNPIALLTSNSAIYGVSVTLQRFVGLLLLPFFTNTLTPNDYGVLSVLTILSILLVGVFNLGTPNSIALLYFGEKQESKRSCVIWSATLLLMQTVLQFFHLLGYFYRLSVNWCLEMKDTLFN